MTRDATGTTHGLAFRLLAAWSDLRASTRALLDTGPGEARLLMLAMLSGLFAFLGQLALLVAGPDYAGWNDGQRAGQVGSLLISAFFVRTLGLYALASLTAAIMRLATGAPRWHANRAAVFWAAAVAALPGLVAHLAASLAPDGPVRDLLASLGSVLFAVALAKTLAEANGVRRSWVVFLAIVGLSAVILGVVIALTSR